MMKTLARSTTATRLAACLLVAFATRSSDAQPSASAPTVTAACTSTLDTPVPAFVIEAAAATPADFATVLTSARICAGFVVRHADGGPMTHAWRYRAAAPAGTLRQALETFRQHHPSMDVTHADGFLLIQEKGIRTNDGPLAKRIASFDARSVRAIDALKRAIRIAAPDTPPAGGMVASILGQPGEPSPTDEDLAGPLVNLRLDDTTFWDVLVAIGRASPGVVWMLVHSDDESTPGSGTPGFRMRTFSRPGVTAAMEGVIR